MAVQLSTNSDLRLRLDSEGADEDRMQLDDGCVEFPQQLQRQPPATPPPPPKASRVEQLSLPSRTKQLLDDTPAEMSFQEQLRAIAFGGSRQKQQRQPTATSGGGSSAEKSAASVGDKVAKKCSVASPAPVVEQDQPSTLDLIAKLRENLSAYQTVAPPASIENDIDDYNRYCYSYADRRAAPTPPPPPHQLPSYQQAPDGEFYDGDCGYDDGFRVNRGYVEDGDFASGARYEDEFEDAPFQQHEKQEQYQQYQQYQQQQQPGSMLQAVRARWAAQREEELERLKEMSTQRQLETQLREECRQLNENLHEKQLEVQAMADQLDLLRRLNEQTKSDLMAAVEKGDFQASELKLVMEEDRQVLEATRRENLELKAKIEGDELEMHGLEGRLAGLERHLQSLQSENARLAQQMRETSLSVQAGAMERQEAGRLGQQLVALETELMRLRREVANQHLVSAAESRKAASAVASAASAITAASVAPPTKLTTTVTASTMTTPRVAGDAEQRSAASVPSRLQRALQMSITGASPASRTTPVERATSPPPLPPRQKQQLQAQEPLAVASPPPPRPQRSPEDEEISNRVRGFLTRLQTPPSSPKPKPPQQLRQQLRPAPMQRLQQFKQQQQPPQQHQELPKTRQQPQIRSASFRAAGSGSSAGGGGSIIDRLRAAFRDAHSAEIRRLAAASAAPSLGKPPTQANEAAAQNPQSSWRPWAAGQPQADQQQQQLMRQRRRSTASSMSNILQGLEALNSFRSGGGGAAVTAVPRLSLETGTADGESMRSENRRNLLSDYADRRELTASARKYADSLVTKYLSQQGTS